MITPPPIFLALLALPLALAAADNARLPRSRKEPASSAPPAAAGPAALGPNADFTAFRLITERNIFNPNRIGRGREDDTPPPRTETIALVGTMDSGAKGRQAFFDSPDAAYRKALGEGDTLVGYTVKAIQPDRIELAAGDKTLSLTLSQQLRRPAGGEWTVAARELPAPTAGGPAAAPAEPPPIPAGASDLLRRLMEQRQKQLKQ